jgi:PAS domain S-box-containing protein
MGIPDNVTERNKGVTLPLARAFNVFTLVAAGYCAVFSIFFYASGNNLLAAVHLFGLLVSLVNYIIIRPAKKFNTGINVVLGIGNFVVVFLFATGGVDGTGLIYPLVYLPFAAFITNRRYTRFWVAVLLGSCLLALALHLAGFITMPYTGMGLFSYFTGFLILIVCIFLFQRNSIDYEEYIQARDKADLSMRRQAALLQMLPDAIIYSDMENRIVSMNIGAEKMLATSADEAKGKHINEMLSFSSLQGVHQKQQTIFDETAQRRNELIVTNRNGEKFTVLANVKTLEKLRDPEAGRVTIYTDISALKLNEELKYALEKLEKNNEYLEQLAYMSAHDIKSPIITVEGLVGLLAQSRAVQNEHGPVLRLLTNTIKQMKRTNVALNNILKVRKNLSQGMETSEQFLPFRHIIDDVKATLQANITEAGAKLDIEIDEVAADLFPAVQFKSIFHNLLSNAIKYRSPQRLLLIKVSAIHTANGNFSFTVQDNGLGMDIDENKDKLFGIFKRFHDHVEGSGVGLHIVKSIVDAYEGSIELESQIDVGTTFKINFSDVIFRQ